jgi:hypothetical protein
MAYPLLISLANIDLEICSRTSLRTYILLTLLPIAKFPHKQSRVQSLLQDRLTHACLNRVLEPLKTAAHVGYMMSDPVGNLCYCYTPLTAYIADTPEHTLLTCVSLKASPFTTATSKQFGDPFRHDLHTGSHTLAAIHKASEKSSPRVLQTHINFPRFLPIFPDFLERLSHLAPIY